MKKTFLLLTIFITSLSFAQTNVSQYKYVVVPVKFDFLSKNDQYQTSALTKFLFKKYGFNAYLENEKLPDDLSLNRCLALTGIVKDDSNMFTVKNYIELRDCNNKLIFTSKIGRSKSKEYKKAYHQAIREAFITIKGLSYTYKGTDQQEVVKTHKLPVSTKITNNNASILYAQPIENGYQLVNNKPEKVFEILKTNNQELFILKNKNGVLYKSNNHWIVEFYEGNTKKSSILTIKF